MTQAEAPAVEEHRFDCDGLKIAARVWGPEEGRPVLALHGWLDNAATFDALAPMLDGIRLVAIDLPGHGHSDHLGIGAAYHFIDGVAHAMAVADALEWDRFCLLGHSMGAGIASLCAGTFPQRIDRLVLVEGLGPLSQECQDAPTRLAKSISRQRHLETTQPRVFETLDRAIQARARGTDLDTQAAGILVRRATREHSNGGIMFRHDTRLKVPSRLRMTEDVVTAFLRAIACPTLIIWAQDGLPFPRQFLAEREAQVAKREVVWVNGGHHVHLTHPHRVADQINAFLG